MIRGSLYAVACPLFDMKTTGCIKVCLYDVETLPVLDDVLCGGIWLLLYHTEVISLFTWSWQGNHTLSLECNNNCYYNPCALLGFWLMSLYKCVAHAALFLEVVYYVQWISIPSNSSLKILRKVWNNTMNLHMQTHMQNSQKFCNFICWSKVIFGLAKMHILLSVYFDLYFFKSFLLNDG